MKTLTAKAEEAGLTAIRILGNIRDRTGGWFDCECGQCLREGDDCHAWEAFEENAQDAIHLAVVVLAEHDAAEIDALRETERRLTEERDEVKAEFARLSDPGRGQSLPDYWTAEKQLPFVLDALKKARQEGDRLRQQRDKLLKRYLDNHCSNADAEGMSALCECKLCLDTRAALDPSPASRTPHEETK